MDCEWVLRSIGMQVQLNLTNQNFNGSVIVTGLSKKQQNVFEKIKPTVTDMFKDKNYNLFISGNTKPDLNCIHVDYRYPPRYVNFYTRPSNLKKHKPKTESVTGSFDHEVWLNNISDLVQRHEQSSDYIVEVPRVQKFKNFVRNLFNKK